MKLKLIILSISILFFGNANAQALPEETNTGGESVAVSDESPEFPGGVVKMMEYVKANIKYPQSVLDSKISGKCNLKFAVNPDGSTSDVTILEGVANCPECDAEATRVILSMPKWKPGKIAGKAVALYYNLSVKFPLPQK